MSVQGLDLVAITPKRGLGAIFDVSEEVVVCERYASRRAGGQIAQLSATQGGNDSAQTNVKFWASSGAWTLKPIQEDIKIHEFIDVGLLIIHPSGMNLSKISTGVAASAEMFTWRQQSELPGLAFDASVAATGDAFLVKSIPVNESWNVSLASSVPNPVNTDGSVTAATFLDRGGESTTVFPEDQGFFIRWELTGTGRHHPDYVWTFYFGQYALAIKGNGKAVLYEYCHPAATVSVPNPAAVWRRRTEFRYARPSQIADAAHTLLIWPHIGPKGEQYIAFSGGELDVAAYLSGQSQTDSQHVAPTEFLYNASGAMRGTDQDESPGHATKSAIIRFDERRDYKIKKQFSKIGFPTSGTLVDQPHDVGMIANVMPTVEMTLTKPAGTDITNVIGAVPSLMPYNPATDHNAYVVFTLTSDGKSTPTLWGYNLIREPSYAITPGSFTGGMITKFSKTGPEGDPSHESATLYIADLTDTMQRLRRRGRLSTQVYTQFQPPGSNRSLNVGLMQGHIIRPHRTKLGITNVRNGGFGPDSSGAYPWGGGTPITYPAPEASDYQLPIAGMWERLAKRVHLGQMRSYAVDQNAIKVNGQYQPWKATDVVQILLGDCGFPLYQIDIGPGTNSDLPYRLWQGHTEEVSGWKVNPGDTYAEIIIRILKNYTGGWLTWDMNAGVAGMWRLIRPPVPANFAINQFNFNPVWNFVTQQPHPTKIPPQIRGQYPANTSVVWGTQESYIVAPEFNSVEVYATTMVGNANSENAIKAVIYNPKSFACPQFPGVVPDPDHPDYIGEHYPLVVVDPALNGTTPEETQKAVNWTCARLFDFLCHGLMIQPFESELVILQDAVTGNYRPLGFQDPVTYDGVSYIIRNANFEIDNATGGDLNQFGHYEAVIPTFY